MRPWIAMKAGNIPFEETVISLDAADFKTHVGAVSGTGKVPVLIDGDVRVWESLAILEYLAEKFPNAGLWPADIAVRAHARAIANEMHAGFLPLRRHLRMNLWRPVIKRELTPEAVENVQRIEAIWSDCRARFGEKLNGPFLFGRYGAADAMYAPVVARLHTYGVEVGAGSRGYMDAVMALPAWREWHAAAVKEPWVLAADEVDWPTVHKA
jgi:glutathione S-transferase